MTTTQNILCVDSIERAFRQVPKDINRVTSIRIPSGDYSDFPTEIINNYESDGMLVLEGLGDPIVMFEGPYEIDSVTTLGDYHSVNIIGVGSNLFPPDLFTNLFLRLKTGAHAGKIFGIFENTSDTVILGNDGLYGESFTVGDTFDIVRPPVRIYIDKPITWKVIENGIGISQGNLNKRARVVINGIEIVNAYDPDEDIAAPFRFIGNGFYLHFSKLQGFGRTHYLEMDNCKINSCLPYQEYIFEERSNEENPSFIIAMYEGAISYMDDFLWIRGINTNVISGVVCRGGIISENNSYFEFFRCITNILIMINSSFSIMGCASKSLSDLSGATVMRSIGKIEGYYCLKGVSAINLLLSNIMAVSLESDELNNKYGLNIGQCSNFVNVSGCTATGTDDDIYFDEISTGADWPSVGAIESDNVGSIVLSTAIGD